MSKIFTLSELQACNSKDAKCLLTSIEGAVYDVSSNPDMYGPGGSYEVFVGHDITYCLAITSLEVEHLDQPYDKINKEAQQRVEAFKERFNSKYPIVGKLQHTNANL